MCGYACRSVVLFASALMPLVASYAQMPPPLYTPNVDLSNAAYARALARLPNNQIVVGSSDLKRVDGVNQNYLARLNSDGSLDNGWNPAPDGAVGAVWVDAAGTLYVGGSFAHIGGQARAGLARFTANGALDPNWAPTQNGFVEAIAAGLSGTVCFGGTFTQFGSATHNHLACVSDVDGSPLAGFTPDVNGTVTTLVSDANNLYVGGFFTSISSVPRSYAARLPLAGDGSPDAWNPTPNSVVEAFLPNGAGQVYLAGFFGALGATSRAGLAKVDDSTGAVVSGWDAHAVGTPFADMLDVCSDGAGGIIAVGTFSAIGGQPRTNMARLDGSTGNAIAAFDPGIDYGYALHVLAEPGGSYLVSGPFAALGGGEHLSLGRVLGAGSVDATFDPSLEAQGYGYVIAALPTPGKFVVGGRFVRANGLIRRNLFKLTSPGIVDPNWIANTDAEVRALSVDANGRIYLGGFFNRVGAYARSFMARLQNTTDGAVDPNWNAQAAYAVYTILARAEGVYAAQSFGAQSYLARLSTADGSVDAGWAPQLNGSVSGLAVMDTGDLLITGGFSSVNSSPRNGAAKLGTGANATLDGSWAPALGGGTGSAIAVEGDNVYLSGSFTTVDAMPRSGLARVSASAAAALDPDWTPSATGVSKLLPRPEGVYIAGTFASVNGGGNGYLARLDDVTGATDPTWASYANSWVLDLLPYRKTVIAAGWFTSIGGQSRQGVARLPVAGDTILLDDFEG